MYSRAYPANIVFSSGSIQIRQYLRKTFLFSTESRSHFIGNICREDVKFNPSSGFVLLEYIQYPFKNNGSIILPQVIQIETIPTHYT